MVDANADEYLICTREEFNQCVQECEANFGNGNMHELSNYRDVVSLGNAPIAKPSHPVFTQAMADNGELPQVGSEVVARYNFDSKQVTHQGVVLYASKYHVILNTIHGNEWHGLIGDYILEPITLPIELTDDEAYQFTLSSGDTFKGVYRSMNDSFYNHHGDFLANYCTNIKLLEVKS